MSLANLEAVWGSYWAQDTHSVLNLLLYLSLGFILYTSSLSFLFLFFLNLSGCRGLPHPHFGFVPGVHGGAEERRSEKKKQKKEEDVPRIRVGVPWLL